MTATLQVDAVTRWGVGPVSFVADKGTFVAITGEPGAGKSTVVGLVAGFTQPDSGRVLLEGIDLHTLDEPELGRRIGWLGAVVPDPGRSRRTIPRLVVGDEPEAPFVGKLQQMPFFQRVAVEDAHRPYVTMLATIRALCEQGALVVVGTHSRVLKRAADQIVEL